MPKVALFSDTHCHPFQPYSTILPNGMNSRLADTLNCIDQIREKCIRERVSIVLFGGDLFHVRKSINVVAFNAVYEALSKFVLNGMPIVMIAGNHDQADRAGAVHSMHAFKTFCTVIDSPSWTVVNDAHNNPYGIFGVPYTDDVKELKAQCRKKPDISKHVHNFFLGHLGVQGAKLGADFVYSNRYDIKLSDVVPETFDAVYFGHYHLHQKLAKNAYYIGAPLQHTWGDANQKRGFLIYDTESKKHKFHALKFPRFMQVTQEDLVSKKLNGDFVRVVAATDWSVDRKEEARLSTGARSVEIVTEAEMKVQTSRINVDDATSMAENLAAYVDSGVQSFEGLNKRNVLELGLELLKEAQSS